MGPWQRASEHEGPESFAVEPRTGRVLGGAGWSWSKALARAHLASGADRPCAWPDGAPGGAALDQLDTRAPAALDSLSLQGPEQGPWELLVWELPWQPGPFPPHPSPHTCLPGGVREGDLNNQNFPGSETLS